MYLVRGGVVEIVGRGRNGEEVPLLTLEPPASLEELAAVGADVVHWASGREAGPVSLVAIGRPDLDALGRNFPLLANKILKKLAHIIAMRLQMLLEAAPPMRKGARTVTPAMTSALPGRFSSLS